MGEIQGEELGQHGNRLGTGHHGHLRILLGQGLDVGGVIRLQVGDYQIIRLFAVQDLLHVLHPLVGGALIHGIHYRDFLVQDHIGIVGNAVGNHILALKKINGLIVRAYIADSLGNGGIFHFFLSF